MLDVTALPTFPQPLSLFLVFYLFEKVSIWSSVPINSLAMRLVLNFRAIIVFGTQGLLLNVPLNLLISLLFALCRASLNWDYNFEA